MKEFSLGIWTDAYSKVPFASAVLAQGNTAEFLVAGGNGDTASVDLNLSAPIEVYLTETPTTVLDGALEAVTIGQRFSYQTPPSVVYSGGVRLNYFQPTARKLRFEGDELKQTTDKESGWGLSPLFPGSTYDFEAWTAELATEEVISNYAAFQVGVHTSNWMHGVLMRMEDRVDLGSDSMVLRIDRGGYAYPAGGPVADTLYLGNDLQGVGLQATLISEDPETLVLQLDGVLRKGDNLILIRSASYGTATSFAPAGPVVLADNRTLTAVLPAQSGECTPASPTCGSSGTCTPNASGTNCSGQSCKNKVTLVAGTVCAPCGGTVSTEKCSTYKGSLVGKIAGSLFGFDLSLTATGEVGGSTCMTVQALPGNCVQGFQCSTVCSVTCDVVTWHSHPDPWSEVVERKFSCIVPGIKSATSCQHASCP